MLIEGVFAAVTTPFYPDERVYFRKLEANIARYSRSLLSGMVVLGSTGEAPALDDPLALLHKPPKTLQSPQPLSATAVHRSAARARFGTRRRP